jgi:nicotinamide phosphoribosyltransferase
VNGAERDVYKRPITDGGKRSKAGRFKLVLKGGKPTTVPATAAGDDLLVPVFRNGEVVQRWTFDEVRRRAGV